MVRTGRRGDRYLLVVALLHAPGLFAVPDLAHAFTTRAGGVSAAPFESLNLGRDGQLRGALLEGYHRDPAAYAAAVAARLR